MSRLLLLTALLMLHMSLSAQDSIDVSRPVHHSVDLSVGQASVRDTYLTPITYSGTAVTLNYEHLQATGFAPTRWTRQLQVGLGYGAVHNPAREGNTMHAVDLTAQWSLMRQWRVRTVPVAFGPMIDLDGGAVYNPGGSNNVMSVKARISLGAAALTRYKTRVGGLPVTLFAGASLPVIGAWFCPDGYESYYEIYLGNHKHLAHTAWWANRVDLNATAGADWQLRGTTLRVVYRFHYENAHARGLDSRSWRNMIGIGIGGDFVTLSHRKH